MGVFEVVGPNTRKAMEMAAEQFGDDVLVLETKKIEIGNKISYVLTVTDDVSMLTKEKIIAQKYKQNSGKNSFDTNDIENIKYKIDAGNKALYEQLKEVGVEDRFSLKIIDEIKNNQPIGSSFISFLDWMKPKKNKVIICLLGSSGVGKTSMTAKLALFFKMKGNSVCIVSNDHDKIDGDSVLKEVSNITKIPFIKCYDDLDLKHELLKSVDYIIIDTKKISIRSKNPVGDAMEGINFPITHKLLVLGANIGTDDGFEMIRKCGENISLVTTKLDEAFSIGRVVNWAGASKKKLSFCSFGGGLSEKIGVWKSSNLSTVLKEAFNRNENITVKNK